MPRTGKPFSVLMTNCGPLGWVSDTKGYRYQAVHPVTGRPWPALPERLTEIWRTVAGAAAAPDACLINIYGATAKMGSHQDRDEADFTAPVVSISLGDTAAFHVGGLTRGDPKTRLELRSGDVFVLGGEARLAFHGVDRIYPGTSGLALEAIQPGCRRVNLTLRRVTATPV
jgi:DNA oxidative demethylase